PYRRQKKDQLSAVVLGAIDDPVRNLDFSDARQTWEKQLAETVSRRGFDASYYVLRDNLKLTIYNPYIPEKEEREQDPYNAIFIQPDCSRGPREISTLLDRLAPVTGAREKRCRYYVPRECRDDVRALVDSTAW
ncbi:MAG TPA: hypothetical protein VHZ24_21115, partial [Pirellulales bacterium]|nr:hypothetical protein [Pirellulales bacterium]